MNFLSIDTLDRKLTDLQEHNAKKLEEMRITVDEKLQKTLNERLAESFKIVSEDLESVNKGLGEMRSLANGVGDLKRVLSNVKTRGILGEIQLGNILEQILSPSQYEINVCTKKESRDHVEFAVKLPGKDSSGLYAEVVRQPALLETLHRDLRVVVTGPSTLMALLNSLQMGFQTLTFEKRSQEIRDILGAVKKEFGNFGKVLENVQGCLHGASEDLEKLVGTRTRKIQHQLRNVEELPTEKATLLLDAVLDDETLY